jgi:hypothetical protein
VPVATLHIGSLYRVLSHRLNGRISLLKVENMPNLTDIGKQINAIPGVVGVMASMNNDLYVYLDRSVPYMSKESQNTQAAVIALVSDIFDSITFRWSAPGSDITDDIELPPLPF